MLPETTTETSTAPVPAAPPVRNTYHDDDHLRPKDRHIVFTVCRGLRKNQGLGYTDMRDVIEENTR